MANPKEIAVVENSAVSYMVKESVENKKAIRNYLDTGDSTNLKKRNIRFVKPL